MKKDILEEAKDIIEETLKGSGCISNYMAYSFLQRYRENEESKCEVYMARDEGGVLCAFDTMPHKEHTFGKQRWFNDRETMEGFEQFFPDGTFGDVDEYKPVKYELIVRKVKE